MNRSSPAAFMSYVRFEDDHNYGRLSELCRLLSAEVRVQTGEEFHIFQDRKDIGWGESWRRRIDESLDAVTFLIPVITPSFFKSEACRNELARFLEREKSLNRSDLVLPIYYVDTPLLNDPEQQANDDLAEVIASHQFADWRHLRFELFSSPIVGKALEQLAVQVRQALERVMPISDRSQQPQVKGTSGAETETEEVGLLEATQASQEMLRLVSKLRVDLNFILARVASKLKRFDSLTSKPSEEKTRRAEQIAVEVASELQNGSERISEDLPKLDRAINIFIRFLSDLLASAEEGDEESIDLEAMLAGLHDKIKSGLKPLRSHRKSILDMAQRSGKIKPAARHLAESVDGMIAPLERFGSFCEDSIRMLNQ